MFYACAIALAVVLARPAGASGRDSTRRVWGGGAARGPVSPFSHSGATLVGATQTLNHLCPGPPIHALDSTAAATVTIEATPPPVRVLCVVDGRGVIEAAPQPSGSLLRTCDVNFLSYGGLHSVAAYGVAADGRVALLGEPLLLRRDVQLDAPAGAALSKLREHESALRALKPAGTAAIGVYVLHDVPKSPCSAVSK